MTTRRTVAYIQPGVRVEERYNRREDVQLHNTRTIIGSCTIQNEYTTLWHRKQPHRTIVAAAGKCRSVRREGQGVDFVLVTRQLL